VAPQSHEKTLKAFLTSESKKDAIICAFFDESRGIAPVGDSLSRACMIISAFAVAAQYSPEESLNNSVDDSASAR